MPPTSPGLPSLASIWQLLELRRLALAEAAARQRLAADPTDWRAGVLLTHALRFLSRLAEACTAATAALALAPDAASAHFGLARVLAQQGQFERAHQSALEALRLSSLRADYYGFRAQLFYVSGSYRAAVTCANEGLQHDSHHSDCLLWRAMAQEQLEKPTAADDDFLRVLRLAPSSALVHEWRGRLLLQRYEPRQANLHLTEALRLDPVRSALLEPLRRARQQRHWPGWLLRLHQTRQHDWHTGLPISWRGPVVSLVTPLFQLRSWWRTRHDPAFWAVLPGQRRALARQWLLSLAVVAALLLMAYTCLAEGVPLAMLLLPMAVLLVGWMKKPGAD